MRPSNLLRPLLLMVAVLALVVPGSVALGEGTATAVPSVTTTSRTPSGSSAAAAPGSLGTLAGARARSNTPAPSIVPGVGVRPLLRGPFPTTSDRHTLGRLTPVASQLAAPVSALHFDAIPRIGPNWPADPIGAIGLQWYFTAANTSYALYDLTGVAVIAPTSFEPFFTYPSGTQVFDPKVVYDQYGQTFVFAYLAVNDHLRRSWIQIVTIPDATAADTSTWCARRLRADQVPGDGRQWADYPGLGYDAGRVVVTSNQFDFAHFDFDYAQVLAFPKTSLYDCTQRAAPHVFAGTATRNPDRSQAFTLQPAQSAGIETIKQYFLSFERSRTSSSLVVWRLKDAASGLRLQRAAISVSRVAISPYGTQAGGSLKKANTWWDPGDLRLINAFYDADLGRLYAAHVIYRDLGPDARPGGYAEAAIRWYEVAPKGRLRASAITRKGIVGTPETDAGWPVVATDGAGNLWVTYSRASAPEHEYLSAWAAQIPPGTNRPTLTLLAEGSARFEATRGPERWGDFNGIARDPSDPTRIVMVNQYAKTDGVGPTRNWQETVDLVSEGTPTPTPTPVPG